MYPAVGPAYAVDVTTWATTWVSPVVGTPTMAIDGGGLVLSDDVGGVLSILDGDGALRATVPMPVAIPQQVLQAGEWLAWPICRRPAGMFMANVPAQNIEISDRVQPIMCTIGQSSQAGRYHTHGAWSGISISGA